MIIDRMGVKFKALSQIGEPSEIIFGQYDLASRKIQYFRRPHSDFDGIGGLLSVLEKQGAVIQGQPVGKPGPKPFLLKQMWLLFKFGRKVAANNIEWLPRVDFSKTGFPERAAFYVFSKEDTKALSEFAAQKKIGLTALFLSALDQVSAGKFLESGSERKWVIPISLRGSVGRKIDLRNVTSSIILRLKENNSSAFVHQRIREYLKENLHWGSWLQNCLQSLLTLKFTTSLVGRYVNGAYGLLSNLGAWPGTWLDATKMDPSKVWVIFPPAVRMTPVSGLMLQWQENLQVSLTLHPCLQASGEELESLLRAWISEVCRASGQAEPTSWNDFHLIDGRFPHAT